VKLLRLFQDGSYLPLGSDVAKRSDARILVATNGDLRELQESGRFRKDLYYRLCAHHVHIPPLRERREDLPLLIDHFLQKAAKALGKKKPTPPPELFLLASTYHFPGNVRELEAMVFDAASSHQSGKLSLESFKAHMRFHQEAHGSRAGTGAQGALEGGMVHGGGAVSASRAAASDLSGSTRGLPWEDGSSSTLGGSLPDVSDGMAGDSDGLSRAGGFSVTFSDHLPTLKQAEDLLVAEAMRRSNNNQSIAAMQLGITRQALNRRIRLGRK
jgi:transcriptional regulator with PAS, ATPase and Fis domain